MFSMLATIGLVAGMLSVLAPPASAATFTVTNLNDAGAGSLRDAMNQANSILGSDTITFNLPGASPWTIHLSSVLGNFDDLTITGPGANLLTISGDTDSNGIPDTRVLSNRGTLNLSGVTIAKGTNAGGGIYNDRGATLTVTDSTFSGNTATDYGGGIFNYDGTLTVTNSTFSGNTTESVGGGIYNYTGPLTVTNSTFSGNTADSGGGIFNFGALNVTNSTFSGNTATSGGGIFNQGPLTVTNSTFSGNSAVLTGGGIYSNSRDPAAFLMSTIVAGNPGGDCAGPYPVGDGGYNLSSDASCGFSAASNSLPSTDPLLGGLSNNGGPTQTMLPGPGSPAIDKTPSNTNGCGTTIATDQRGITRPQGTNCDIGAVEVVVPTCTITGTAAGETLTGTTGNDFICGLGGNDTIKGLGGNDTIQGGDGADTMYPGSGNDSVDGGLGTDTVSYFNDATVVGGVTVNLATTAAQNTVGAGTDTITTTENLIGTNSADSLTGTTGTNTIYGKGNNDTISGGDGNDTLLPGLGNDTVDGGVGTDMVSYADVTTGVTVNLGTAGAQNTVGAGTDAITTTENLTGTNLADTLTGSTGANTIYGKNGADSLSGGDGNDTLLPGIDNDTVNGGVGLDTVSYADLTAGVTVDLSIPSTGGAAGTDTLSLIERATGTNFVDSITGTNLVNILNGLGGNDSIFGLDGNDTLDGGLNTDSLDGGIGTDTCKNGETLTNCEL
jgi:predicted outer membrane repeat protein